MLLVSRQPLPCSSYVQSYVSNIWHCTPHSSFLDINPNPIKLDLIGTGGNLHILSDKQASNACLCSRGVKQNKKKGFQ